MLIKVCGLKDKGNVIELLSKVSPDFMGMIFYEKSKRFIGTNTLSIVKNIPKVGVFVNASKQYIIDMQKSFGFELVQLHGDEDRNFIKDLKQDLNVKIIKVFRITDKIDFDQLKPFEALVDYFLFDTQTHEYGGSGKQFDWKLLEEYSLDTPFILSGGIDIEHAEELLLIHSKNPRMVGVDINSKFETEPGIKDPVKVAKFINIIRDYTINQVRYDRNR